MRNAENRPFCLNFAPSGTLTVDLSYDTVALQHNPKITKTACNLSICEIWLKYRLSRYSLFRLSAQFYVE